MGRMGKDPALGTVNVEKRSGMGGAGEGGGGSGSVGEEGGGPDPTDQNVQIKIMLSGNSPSHPRLACGRPIAR